MYFSSAKENTCFACWDLSASFNILTMQHDRQKNGFRPSVIRKLLTPLNITETFIFILMFQLFLFESTLFVFLLSVVIKVSIHSLFIWLGKCVVVVLRRWVTSIKKFANVIKLKIWWGEEDKKMVYQHPNYICISWIFMSCTQPNTTGMKGVRLQKVWQTSLLFKTVSILFLYFF